MGDLLDAVSKVIKREDNVTRLDDSVGSLTDKLSGMRDRVIRLQGLLEGAQRSRAAHTEARKLPQS